MFVSFVVRLKPKKKLPREPQVNFFSTLKQKSYDLRSVKEGYFLSFLGSMVAGFITTCASLPVDIAKTRTQNMKVSHEI